MSRQDMASIGTATGSRVDSAAKHIMACKVDSRLLGNWIQDKGATDPTSYMHNTKMQWCMHKDEIVLNTTKKINNTDTAAKAYPLVVSTVGEMHADTKKHITQLYKMSTAYDFYRFMQPTDSVLTSRIKDTANAELIRLQIKGLPEFRCQGVALGQAWASYMSGDTVASVLVGGMMTVLNGHFTMHTGDEVQWYFDFEKEEFLHTHTANGSRVPTPQAGTKADDHDPKRRKKEDFMDQRLYGTGGGYGKSVGVKHTDAVVRIKSYRMQMQDKMIHFDHFGDKSRVFAKCISGGRPFDMVDIMLMTQSS
jgi:hypothetical protein